jgi:hypothetical protein
LEEAIEKWEFVLTQISDNKEDNVELSKDFKTLISNLNSNISMV